MLYQKEKEHVQTNRVLLGQKSALKALDNQIGHNINISKSHRKYSWKKEGSSFIEKNAS
jgi:hypothetical protein